MPYTMKKTLIILTLLVCTTPLFAQTNIRAWNASGQVFVVWELDADNPLIYQIYFSNNDVSSTVNAQKVGSVFEPEWLGERLKEANPNARWRIPNGNGGLYQLTANEGLFVYTPHDTMTRYIYVVKDNSTVLNPSLRIEQPLLITYNPVTDPVTCHVQLSGITGQGFPFTIYAMWVDGQDNPYDARPDFPVMANRAKNGAPHVFAVFRPEDDATFPATNRPAVVCLHGGGQQGSYWSYAPNSFHYGNTGNAPVDGYSITFDDRIFLSNNGVVNLDRPTNWFGWHTQLNATTAINAPANAVVVPYTLRRLDWTIDWLIHDSELAMDSTRIAIMGNSMGGTGTLLLSRWRPNRFSAASSFVPPHYTPETAGRLFGTTQTNLKTTEVGPDGDTLRVNDFFDASVRISPVQRDYCLTRIYRGRCDDAAEWGAQHVQLFNTLNDLGIGVHLYWDNRDHTASDWDTDDPQTTCNDIGQWVSPNRTERCEVSYQSKFRSNQSYPGFSNDDQDVNSPGIQPELGNGDINDGAPWGTWSGYYDWEVNTIKDTVNRWECTLFLVGQSDVAIDNYPGDSARCDVSVRKPQLFLPQSSQTLNWRLIDLSDNSTLQSGTIAPDENGVVKVDNLMITKEPNLRRLIIETPSTLGDTQVGNTIDRIHIYPNPASAFVQIKTDDTQLKSFELLNAIGQSVLSGAISDPVISLQSLPNGFYTLIISDNNFNQSFHKLHILKP